MLFTISIKQENDGNWLAQIDKLSKLAAHGNTPEEATMKVQTLALQTLSKQPANDEIPVFYWRQDWGAKAHTVRVSPESIQAPSNYQELEKKVVTSDGDGLWETWHGSGISTNIACGFCGNSEGNKQIYGNWGCSYPNGNSWDDSEIECAQCQKFTLICEFQEG